MIGMFSKSSCLYQRGNLLTDIGIHNMAEINLLDKYPRSNRPIEERGKRKLAGSGWLPERACIVDNTEILLEQKLLSIARQFGKEYFDGDRLYGYGGYYYNPKYWSDTVIRFRDHYKLKDDASILDIGCAKGFLIYDFQRIMPKSRIAGVDISRYANDNAKEEVKEFIRVGNAAKLPYNNNSFDLVISINTIDHLPLDECKQALMEIQRVAKSHAYITVNAWRTEKERELLVKWNLTAVTYMHVDDWKKLFEEVGYKGDYWWFVAE